MTTGRRTDTRSSRSTVERLAAGAERPLARAIGSLRANPLPHAGTISVFLLAVVTLSGIYITLFYEFGFDASYAAVEDLTDHPVQRVVRGIHRYSSAALVVTTLVHAWRVFVAGRFSGGRRFRWLTGVAALVLVWLAGVTGYWLVWDLRGQALGESVQAVFGGYGWGASLIVDHLIGAQAGSGAGLMVFVWFVHVLLTAAIGWFAWRHLRRTRLAWMPPRHWMVVMGVGLVVLSVVLPADLLDAADPTRLTPGMPLDPFMLFLLPPLLSGGATWVVIAMVAAIAATAFVPWVLRDRTSGIVEIEVDKCTGCELCVIDCPYLALDMAELRTTDARRSIAVVDPAACVGCGICVGSCSFGAMSLDGFAPTDRIDPDGERVVVACERHLRTSGTIVDDGVEVLEVRCTGMFHAQAVGDLVRRGAESVQVIGCAPGDCAFGIGNDLTHERLDGTRAPHLQRSFADSVTEDYVAQGAFAEAVASPGRHPATVASDLPTSRRSRLVAGGVVAASLAGVGAATLIPYDGNDSGAAVRVIVDHQPGRQLIGQPTRSASAGGPSIVEVWVDGAEVSSVTVPSSGGRSVGVVDTDVAPGEFDLRVVLIDGASTFVLHDAPTVLGTGRRIVLEALDVPPPPGVAEGRRVFNDPRRGGCGICHSTKRGDDGVGPSLSGVATRAAELHPGLTPAEYLRESIIDPDAVIAEGFRAGQMLPIYEDRLTDEEIESLVEYLLTFEESS